MKKTVCLLLIIALLASTAVFFGGCIFNDGSADEMIGIFGLLEYFYRDSSGEVHSFGETFDYYLVVLEEQGRATVIYKRVDGEEVVVNTTYTLNSSSSEPEKITSITLKDFHATAYKLSSAGLSAVPDTNTFSLETRPMRRDLVNNKTEFTRNKEDTIVTVHRKHVFHKLSAKTTAAKIEAAKKKQISTRESRVYNSSNDTEDSDS